MVASMDQCQHIWKSALEVIQSEIADRYVFETFFLNNTYLYRLEGDEALITVKSKTSRVLLENKFIDNIQNALQAVTETNFRCVIKEHAEMTGGNEPEIKTKVISNPGFASNLTSSLNFDTFVVGNCNREAHTASFIAATERGTLYNPIFIYGKSGIGKTHLLNAIGNYIRVDTPTSRVLYVETRDFIDDYIKSAKNKNFDELTKKYEMIDVLLIDDIQFLVGSSGTSEFFFNVFNKLINQKKQIVLTSDRVPNDLRGLETRLVSRFSQGLSVKIESPQFDTAISILKRKVAMQKLEDLSDEVLQYIASKYCSDVRQLEGALNRIIFFSINNNTPVINLAMATAALAPLGEGVSGGEVTIKRIIDIVCDYYSLSREQLTSRVRTNRLANARHIAMYLCRDLIKDSSFVKIANEFGGRDHTTVMNACEKIDKLIKTDADYQLVIKKLKEIIEK